MNKASFFFLTGILFFVFGNSACQRNGAEFSFFERPHKAASDDTKDSVEVASPPEVGKRVPDFEMKNGQGRSFKLSDFRGNIVFLNFWATWCPPCIEEFPAMEELNTRFRSKDFTMIAVSVDDSWEEINQFFDRLSRPPSFLVLLDEDKKTVTEVYGTKKFPETFIIGREGELLQHYQGSFNWVEGEKFEEILTFLEKTE